MYVFSILLFCSPPLLIFIFCFTFVIDLLGERVSFHLYLLRIMISMHDMNEEVNGEEGKKRKNFMEIPKSLKKIPSKGPNLQQTILLLQQENPPPTFFLPLLNHSHHHHHHHHHRAPIQRKQFPSPPTTATRKIGSRNPKRNPIDIPTNHRLGDFFATVRWALYV